MCIKVIVSWIKDLFTPEPLKSWIIRIKLGKQAAVRNLPDIYSKVIWRMVETEFAIVGVNEDGTFKSYTQHVSPNESYLFYYIAFKSKRGWILFSDEKMTLELIEVPNK